MQTTGAALTREDDQITPGRPQCYMELKLFVFVSADDFKIQTVTLATASPAHEE